MRNVAALALLFGLVVPAGAQVEAGPQDPWTLGQAPENCYLSRTLDAGGQKAGVLIQSFGMGSPYHVVVRSAAIPLRPQRADVAQIGFGSASPTQQAFVILGKWNGTATAVFAATRRQVTINGEFYYYKDTHARPGVTIDPAAQDLSLDIPDMVPMTIHLGDMTGEYDRLDACTKELEAKWSAAASGGVEIAKAPELLHPGEANWHMKYPNLLLLNLISGIAEVRATVDEKGRARDCVVQVSTWAPQFGEDSCAALKEVARFDPARDTQGNPVKALFRTTIMFVNYKWS